MNTKERKELIRQLAEASGVAQYAFEDALKQGMMTDDELQELSRYVSICSLLKPAVMKNRAKQKSYTRMANRKTEEVGHELNEANRKLQEFMNLQNSEIIQAGRWLLNALSNKGDERKAALRERELVHQADYTEAVNDMGGTISHMREISAQNKDQYGHIVKHLEQRIDNLTDYLKAIKQKVVEDQGLRAWERIEKEVGKN
jgi:hypothetical protein